MTVIGHWRTSFKASFLIWNGCTLVVLCCFIFKSVRENISFHSDPAVELFFLQLIWSLLIFISYLEDKASTHADYMINLKSMKVDWTHLKEISRGHWNAQTGQTASHDVLWTETTTMAWMNVCKREEVNLYFFICLHHRSAFVHWSVNGAVCLCTTAAGAKS